MRKIPFRLEHRSLPGMVEILSVAMLSLTALNCWKDPLTPVPPSWDVNLTFPIAAKNVSLGDVLEKDSSSLSSDAQSRLVFSSTMEATPVVVGNQLTITPSSANAAIQLGSFAVDVNPITVVMNPVDLPPGSFTSVPPRMLSFPDVQASLLSSGGATFKSGTISLTLKNNSPIAIVPTQPIILVDDRAVEIVRFNLGTDPIFPTQTRTCYSDLAEVTIGSSVNITNLTFSTPGSGVKVSFPTDSMFVATIGFTNALASSVQLSSVPAQRLVDNDKTAILLDDSTLVKLVGMRSGILQFAFENKIDVGVQFRFRLENLYRRVGGILRQYEDSVYLPALNGRPYTMDLSGCELQSMPGELLNALDLTSSVIIPVAVNNPVSVHDTDKVQIAMTTGSPIMVDTVSGALKPTWVNINTAVALAKGDYPSKLKGQFVIPSASLIFNAMSEVGYPADLYVTLSAVRSDGQVVSLPIPAGQRRIMPGISTIAFDPSDVGQFLSQFSGGLPDSLRITGKVLVNPPDCYTTDPLKVGGVSSSCAIGGSVTLTIPLTVGISQASYRDTVAFGQDADGSNKKPAEDQLKNVNTAKLHLEVQNGLPAQVGVRIHILDRMHQEILTLPQSGPSLLVNASSIDAQGFASVPGSTSLVIELNHAEAQQYSAAEFVDYEVDIATPQGATASFRTSDEVHVRVWTECSMGVNK